jgi:hypothetical protein
MVSVVGALSILGLIWIDVGDIFDPVQGILVNKPLDVISALFIASGFVAYFVIRAIQRRRGVDIGLNFAEIPPE